MKPLNESIVEDAALEWFGALGYIACRQKLSPGLSLRAFGAQSGDAIRQLNPAIPIVVTI